MSDLTVQELVSTLKHSVGPSIVVEGKDDMTILRWLEYAVRLKAALLVCGGRTDLLAVYARRAEFSTHPVAFLADRDLWVFTGVPSEFSAVVFTTGYSIENDMLMSGRLEELMDAKERQSFYGDLDYLASWFAFVAETVMRGQPAPPCALHPNQIVPVGTAALSPEVCAAHHYVPPSVASRNRIRRSYKRFIRGKSVIELMLRYLSHTKRQSKYSRQNLMELGVKLGRRPRYLLTLADAIRNRLDGYTATPGPAS